MPRYIEVRYVSESKWYSPKSWGTEQMEWRSVWDMDRNLTPDELADFVDDQLHGNRWRRTEPPQGVRVRIL